MAIIGYDVWGLNTFRSASPPIRNIKYLELSNAIYDEVHLRDKTDNISTTNTKEDWQLDTRLLARFMGDLEAGNINNAGIKIAKFAIKRRKINELKSITLGYKDFVNNNQFVFKDYTQPNDTFIYSIVPVGENGLEGQENPIEVKSDFTGYYLVDKENNEVLAFDKYLNDAPEVEPTLNMNETQIDTMSRFPQFYRSPQRYHTFSLTGIILPDEWGRSGNKYQEILNKYVYTFKPFLVKASNGSVYVVKVSQPRASHPQNSYQGYDYLNLTMDFTEIMSYEDYMDNGGA